MTKNFEAIFREEANLLYRSTNKKKHIATGDLVPIDDVRVTSVASPYIQGSIKGPFSKNLCWVLTPCIRTKKRMRVLS